MLILLNNFIYYYYVWLILFNIIYFIYNLLTVWNDLSSNTHTNIFVCQFQYLLFTLIILPLFSSSFP